MKNKRKIVKTITAEVGIDTYDVIDSIVNQFEYEDILEFIKKLDLAVEDWDFTNSLYSYFKEQHDIYEKEMTEEE